MRRGTQRILVSWLRLFGIGLIAYVAAVSAAACLSTVLGPGAVRNTAILLPLLPGLYLLGVTIRMYRRCDEYVRLRVLHAVAGAAVVTAAWTLVYAFLESVGLPRIDIGWVSNIGWAAFAVLMLRFMTTDR
jgi:hypothetical protein